MSTDSIGSGGGRDWSNVADWWAAIPATLTENEVGELYNDSEVTVTSAYVLSGKTAGPFTINLRPAAGQGFKDSTGNPSFKLSYQPTLGVAFKCSTDYAQIFNLNNAKTTLSGLQMKHTSSSATANCITFSGADQPLKDCITDQVHALSSSVVNCLILHRRNIGSAIDISYGRRALACTIVGLGGSSGPGVKHIGGGAQETLKNTIIVGYTVAIESPGDSGFTAESDNNAIDTNDTIVGANSIKNIVPANVFISTTDDFRLKAGAVTIGAGVPDGTNYPNDIVGTARGAQVDIGCYEFAGGGAFNISLGGAISPSANLIRQPRKFFAGAISPSGAVANIKTILKSLAGAISPSGSLINQTRKTFTAAISPAGALLKQGQKKFTGAISPTGALTNIKAILRSFSGSISPSGALIRQTQKLLSGSTSPAGALIKSIAKRFTAAISPSGALATLKAVLRSFSGAISPSGSLVSRTGKSLGGALSPAGLLIKLTSRSFSGAIAPSGAVLKSILKRFSGAISPIGALVTQLLGTLFQKRFEADVILCMEFSGDVTLVQSFAGDVQV